MNYSVNGLPLYIELRFMKSASPLLFAACLGISLVLPVAAADEKPAFKNDKEKASYAIGVNIGTGLKRSNMDVDVDVISSGMKDILSGKEPKLNEMQAREAIMSYQQEAQKKIAEKNKKEGEAFLSENKKKPGVKTQEVTLPDGTKAEFQYKVITEGKGEMPKSNDVVTVNYKGTLINGTEFDSSAKHGRPMERAANQLVRGWTEALQMMKTGSKWELYLPASLAYGDRGQPPIIEPGATLIFEIELLSFKAPPAPQPSQPLTSDIIRVPSADELKKGAKIEVLKPEDVEKAARAATNGTLKATPDTKKP
jgi:FKBP-type peptidyl-prolyl cis-trans isomerase FklB